MKAIFLLVCLLATSCYQDDGDFCTAPHGVTADQTCYAGNGLKLRAGDYGKSSGDFQWEVYALKDTARTSDFTANDLKLKVNAGNQLTVADSIVKSNQRLIVKVANNCGGELKYSSYHAFVKINSAANPCINWVAQ